jgi:hypothetical protein
MNPKEGDLFLSILDGIIYMVKRIVHKMVILESIDGERHILTGFEGLKLFYRKKNSRRHEAGRIVLPSS